MRSYRKGAAYSGRRMVMFLEQRWMASSFWLCTDEVCSIAIRGDEVALKIFRALDAIRIIIQNGTLLKECLDCITALAVCSE
jgi:hypothetical protein